MHYETMTLESIMALNVPIAEDAILFLWATNPKLKEALQIMESWGFEYKTNLVWVKERFGTGYYVRGQHELLLIGRKGNITVPNEEDRPSSVLQVPAREHSHKPDEVYNLIEKMYPNNSKLELFARGQQRQGWTKWGAEVA
jgi:N6-adenosine-specific RNA methylase IME4